MPHFVIVGAGQAGQSLASKLRSEGFDGAITLIGSEPVLPYQRPPLSKKYLLGDMELERLFLRPEAYYADTNIALRLGQSVTGVDPAGQALQLGGEVLRYDALALTTGAVPRELPAAIGGDLDGVYTVRSIADVDAMSPEFQPDRHLLIVGGGYIGLEAAAVAARKGLKVTLIEMADRILARVACAETAAFLRDIHTREGVDIREATGLTELRGKGRVTSALLSDGSELAVDFVIAGVGVTPDTALAEAAGLTIDNGIATDSHGRTSDPHIWAAGDCASFPYRGERIRLESVGNAIDQAEVVAQNMLGRDVTYGAKPWFWSDQFDLKLQIAGLNTGYDRVVTRAGEAGDAVSFWYYSGDELLATDAINDPRAYMVAKRLIEAGKSPTPDRVAGAETVKELMTG
ncbi:NAD(P)/FAD-dependent oxidoreductase [Halovulum sp. GXIMD14793]